MTLNPRVWVGCLGCYNAGVLVGAWVDAAEAEDFEPHSILHGDYARDRTTVRTHYVRRAMVSRLRGLRRTAQW